MHPFTRRVCTASVAFTAVVSMAQSPIAKPPAGKPAEGGAFAGGGFGGGGMGGGEAPTAPLPKDAVIEIAHLKHIGADQAEEAIRLATDAIRCLALNSQSAEGEGSRRLLLVGAKAEIARATEVLKLVDVEDGMVKTAANSRLVAYPVKFTDANLIAKSFDALVGQQPGSKIVLDPRTNSVLVEAPETVHLLVRRALEVIDQPVAERPETAAEVEKLNLNELQVRLVWLVCGKTGTEAIGAPLPPDMADVAKELAELGLRTPLVVAQALVPAPIRSVAGRPGPGSEDKSRSFELNTQARTPAENRLTFKGSLFKAQENRFNLQLKLRVDALKKNPPGAPAGFGMSNGGGAIGGFRGAGQEVRMQQGLELGVSNAAKSIPMPAKGNGGAEGGASGDGATAMRGMMGGGAAMGGGPGGGSIGGSGSMGGGGIGSGTAMGRGGGVGGDDSEADALCNLAAEITAPLNDYVVLGVAPVGDSTSIFVIQLRSPNASRMIRR